MLMAARLAHGQITGWERAAAESVRAAALLPESPRPGRAGMRLSMYLGMRLCTPVTRAVIAGRLDQAEALWHTATQQAERLGFTPSREGVHDAFHIMLQLYGYLGRSCVLEPWVDKRLRENPESRWFAALLKAQFALERGDRAEATRHFALLRETDLRPALGERPLPARPETLVRLSDACVEVGTAEDAQKLYALLAPRAESYIQDGALIFWGAGARALGALALRLERWSAARSHLEAALAMNERVGHRPELARTQLGLARLHHATGRESEARALLSLVVSAAKDMGMTKLAESALQLEARRVIGV